jgi:hypothetical protein
LFKKSNYFFFIKLLFKMWEKYWYLLYKHLELKMQKKICLHITVKILIDR